MWAPAPFPRPAQLRQPRASAPCLGSLVCARHRRLHLRPLVPAVAGPAFHSSFARCLDHAGCPAACPAPSCSFTGALRRSLSRGSSHSAVFLPRRGCRPPAWLIARVSSSPIGDWTEGGSGVGSPPGPGTYCRVAVCPWLGVIPMLASHLAIRWHSCDLPLRAPSQRHVGKLSASGADSSSIRACRIPVSRGRFASSFLGDLR